MKLLSTISILFLAFAVGAQADWEQVEKEDDITVYVRKQEGSSFKEVKILGKINCPLVELVQALEGVEAQSEWVESTKEARIIEKNGLGSFVFYQASDMPYPVKDRDVILEYKRLQDPISKAVEIDFQSVSGKLPVSEDYVRIPELHSSYVLTPAPTGDISVEYLLKVDVGGSMPKWVVNLAITKGPIETMEALFKAIKAGKYKGAQVEGVSEL